MAEKDTKTDTPGWDAFLPSIYQKFELKDHIAQALIKFTDRISDIKLSAQSLMPHADKWLRDELLGSAAQLAEYAKYSKPGDPRNPVAIKFMFQTLMKMMRFSVSEIRDILAVGHLLTLFSAFDAFTGQLLTAIYTKRPELYQSLNGSMTIAEMLKYQHLDSIKGIILRNDIDSFRRDSYTEQFSKLENRFRLQLKKFSKWSAFVECSQRRNLFTHADGIVNEQYLSVCEKEGYSFPSQVAVGQRLKADKDYVISACDLLMEVGLKLGQTLWRKIFPEELGIADKHLQGVLYRFLCDEEWGCAIMAGEYALSLPKCSSEVMELVMLVNYIIALKRCGQDARALELLDARDWSAVAYDFRLAEKVLREDYDAAFHIMRMIGKKGDIVEELAYHTWPLFWNFRQSKQFLQGYKEVYGYEFSEQLVKAVEKEAEKVEAEVAKKESEIATTEASACPQQETRLEPVSD